MNSEPKLETPPTLEVRYEYVLDDMTNIAAETHKGTYFFNTYVVIILSIFFIFLLADAGIALIAMLLNDGSIKIDSPNMIARAIVGLTILVALGFVLKFVGSQAAKKGYKITGKNGLFCEHTVALNDKGFVETTEVNGSFQAWEGVDRIKETENYLTIYVRLGAGYSIPKRAFADERALREFVDTAENFLMKANDGAIQTAISSS